MFFQSISAFFFHGTPAPQFQPHPMLLARRHITAGRPPRFSTLVPPVQLLSNAARIQLDTPDRPLSLIHVATLPRPTLAELSRLSSDAFMIYPHFFSADEQRVLANAALTKLGRRRRRNRVPAPTVPVGAYPLNDVFGLDTDYAFEEGHFDGVIRDYRELTVSSWPESSPPGLAALLLRLYRLLDPRNTPPAPGIATPPNIQTHVLHLASTGFILPHVDNVEASGSVIAGVSLGDTRVMRLSQHPDVAFDVLLESGSVYVQRDEVRYKWKHEIPNVSSFRGRSVGGGQRLSIMLRDKYRPHPD